MSRTLPPFQFKQFQIAHDKCAMKIGVDGVLLAAWSQIDSPEFILDIGTGSGVIASILQQRFPKSSIDAIEPNAIAFQQAKENFKLLPFSNPIHVFQSKLQNFEKNVAYDLIVSNPPFFKEEVSSGDENRDEARQAKFLPLDSFFEKTAALLSKNGVFNFIYPTSDCATILEKSKQHNFNLIRQTTILPTPEKPSKRTLFSFSKQKHTPVTDQLIIEFERGEFTNEYKELTKEFYLNF